MLTVAAVKPGKINMLQSAITVEAAAERRRTYPTYALFFFYHKAGALERRRNMKFEKRTIFSSSPFQV